MRAILVCVEYSDLLAVTLPYNRHQFEDVMVVTTPNDKMTQMVAMENNAQLHCTNSFYANKAVFNKWIALEEGLDKFGREGRMCVMDADILWPKMARGYLYRENCLYTPIRRLLTDTNTLLSLGPPPEHLWYLHPEYTDYEWAGYSQIFDAADSALKKRPWYETDWKHAGGADSTFQYRWDRDQKLRPDWEVLHIGLPGRNWCGRVTPYLNGQSPDKAGLRKHVLHTMIMERYNNKADRVPDIYHHERLS